MSLRVERRDRIAILTLDRPEVRNAFDEALIADLTKAYVEAGRDSAIRAVLLGAEGPAFSAGGDLGWMQRMVAAPEAESLADTRRLAELMRTVDTCPKPTLVRIQGSAFAGALGLIACSDIAVAVPEALFAVSEVRLGLIPAVIAPYVVRAIGPRAARWMFLTAQRITAVEACRLGLVHEVVPQEILDATIERYVTAVLDGGPEAIAAAKRLVADVDRPIDAALIEETARRLALIRATPEAAEGLTAFFAKRKPGWAP